jgi:hypothetical protein
MLHRRMVAAILAVLLVPAFATTAIAAGAGAGSAKVHHRKTKRKAKKRKAPASLTVSGGTLTLTPSAAAAAAFAAHKLTIEVAAPATLGASDAVTLPIASGKLNPSTGYGSLTLSGGYTYAESSTLEVGGLGSFTSGATASFASLTIAFGASSALTADVDGQTGPFFTLKSVKPARSGGTLTLSGVPVTVPAGAVNLLNGFATPTTFAANGPFGTLSVQATV